MNNDDLIYEPKNTIKSKQRVQLHGEVFTPSRIVNLMLDQPGVKECCENLLTTFLEPSAGEGAFLTEVLKRKLSMVSELYNNSLEQFENYSLVALSTLYGIELLEDNAQKCVMNIYEMYYSHYLNQVDYHRAVPKKSVLNSAKTIIAKNIVQGNSLTNLTLDNEPIVFSEWKPIILRKNQIKIKITRTEYTLDEIIKQIKKEPGSIFYTRVQDQLSLFEWQLEEDTGEYLKEQKFTSVNVTQIYKEEVENIYGN